MAFINIDKLVFVINFHIFRGIYSRDRGIYCKLYYVDDIIDGSLTYHFIRLRSKLKIINTSILYT